MRTSLERRLVLVIGAVMFVDMMFYAAIAPLLPTLARELHLSKLSAGVMTAAFPAGTLVGSLPGGVLAVRAGPKRTVYVGLVLLAASTLAFGFLNNAILLDLARFVEGFGSACSWAGGLAWIVSETAPERRGSVMGTALSAAVAGALFGPVIGTIADAVGREAAFSGVVVISLVLIDQARRLPLLHTPSGQGVRYLLEALRDRRLLVGLWLVALPAIASGAITVLGPLRLHRLGAAAGVIGATYVAGAALEASISPFVGRVSDRQGRMLPIRIGLATTIPLLVCFTLPSAVPVLALLIVAIDGSLAAFWAPSMALLSDAAEARRLDQGLAAALINLGWAAGEIVGSIGAGGIAKSSGDALPMTLVAGLCAVTLVGAVGLGRQRAAMRSAASG
ncbi:MAG: MFS transporter [Solirubrobacterales bacterium]|nr:MFS transporter [Solirubrobacterales bacterium]